MGNCCKPKDDEEVSSSTALIEQKSPTMTDSRLDEVEDELYQKQRELGKLQEQLKAREREIESLNSKISTAAKERDSVLEDNRKRAKEIGEGLDTVLSRIRASLPDVKSSKQSSIKGKFEEIERLLDITESNRLQSESVTSNETLDLQIALTEKEGELKSANKKIADLRSKLGAVTTAESQLETLRAELNAAQEQAEAASGKVGELEAKLLSSEQDHSTELRKLQEDVAASRGGATSELAALQAENSDLKAKLEAAKSFENQDKDDSSSSSEEEELFNTNPDAEEKQSQIDQLRAQLDEAKQELETLQAD